MTTSTRSTATGGEPTGDPTGDTARPDEREPDPPQPHYAFFMLVRTTPAWLALTPQERFGFLDETIAPLLRRHGEVSMRFFDSEAFTADYSDVVLWETADPLRYQALVEELRETRFWGAYFDVRAIVASIENAYALHYRVAPYG